jgi:hypothetical protein
MAEGLSATEVGKEIGEHAAHAHSDGDRRDYLISIAEALLLSIVAIVAAWSGYSAAKWSTESSLELAKASATRTKANGAFLQSFTVRAQDASNFNAWFAAYLAHDRAGQRVAEHRFRPGYDVAFRAWLETHPFTNPSAPKGPQYMPQYHPPGLARSVALNGQGRPPLRGGREGRNYGRQVRARHRDPGQRALHRRNQRPFQAQGRADRPCFRRYGAPRPCRHSDPSASAATGLN